MPVCAGCGGSYEISQSLCPYCGRTNNSFTGSACPVCQKVDKVSKVSTIFDTGQNYLRNYSDSSKVENICRKLAPPIKPKKEETKFLPRILLEGTISIIFLIASLDAYFKVPTNSLFSPVIIILGFYIVVESILSLFGYRPLYNSSVEYNNKYAESLLLISTIIVFIISVIGFVDIIFKIIDYSQINKKIQEKYEDEIIPWNKKMNRWKASYYCSRDDVVYIPNENKGYHALDMQDFLNR